MSEDNEYWKPKNGMVIKSVCDTARDRSELNPLSGSPAMHTLFDKTKRETVEYTYQVNGGGMYNIRERGTVTLRFENGKFKNCDFPFSGQYSRNGWRILAAIEGEIELIEKELNLPDIG